MSVAPILTLDVATHRCHCGRRCGGVEPKPAPRFVTAGPLVIDLEDWTVHADGVPLALSGRERELLVYLAGRAGRLCRYRDVTAAIWGEAAVPLYERTRPNRWHPLHVLMTNLRRRLGPAGALIETMPQLGYVLHADAALTAPSGGTDAAND